MAKIRKRPVVIEAMKMQYKTTMHIPEQEPKVCEPGDWLVRDIEGNLYFVKNSVFVQTYDVIDPEHGT